jgi:2-polyprenyl-6-hydroxyphenyl methylase/3-demethylubiquinone-9 3-methyltransferase
LEFREQAGVSAAEIARFDALAGRWWDPNGPMRPLHRMNPLRVSWVDARIRARFAAPVRLLDVGCGAGLAAEALAKPGRGLPLDYRDGVAEALVAEGKSFQAITALEVIEHVPDPAAFLRVLATLLEPNGLLFVSTLNRTTASFLAAKLGAEYLLRWLPVGTHDWRKFLTPSELGAGMRAAGLRVTDISGMMPALGGWRASCSTAVNYIVAASR